MVILKETKTTSADTSYIHDLAVIKMKKNLKLYLIILFSGLIIGVFEGLTNFFTSILIFGGTMAIASIAILVTIYGIWKSKHLIQLGIVTVVSMIISFGIMLLTKDQVDNYRQEIANSVITEIEEFRSINGVIPRTLNEIDCHEKLEILNYDPDSSLQLYTLGYLMDGWNQKFYNSRTEKWMIID